MRDMNAKYARTGGGEFGTTRHNFLYYIFSCFYNQSILYHFPINKPMY